MPSSMTFRTPSREKDLVDLAKELIDRKSGPFDPAAFKDHYGDALRALVEEKRKHGKVVDDEEEEEKSPRSKGNVIDLMEALRKSVGKKARPKLPAKASKPKAPAKKTTRG